MDALSGHGGYASHNVIHFNIDGNAGMAYDNQAVLLLKKYRINLSLIEKRKFDTSFLRVLRSIGRRFYNGKLGLPPLSRCRPWYQTSH